MTKRPYMLLSSSSPIIFDGTLAQCFFVHLHNNVSTAKVRNVAPGVTYTFVFEQDSKGGRAFLWPPECRNPSDVGRDPNRISVHNYIGNDGGYLDATMPRT